MLPSTRLTQAKGLPTVGGVAYVGSGLPTLKGFSTLPLVFSNVGTGDTDLFTVPTGKKYVVFGQAWNSTAASITFYCQVKLGDAVYRPTVAAQTLANTATAAAGLFSVMILEAGQIFSIHTTGTGLNLTGTIYVFDANVNIRTAFISSFINGNNPVYTCPTGKKAYIYGHLPNHNSVGSCGSVQGYNNSAGSLTYKWNYVPNGGTPSTANQIDASIVAAAGAGTPASFGLPRNTLEMAFTAGDSLSVNSTSNNANQLAWVNIVEQKA